MLLLSVCVSTQHPGRRLSSHRNDWEPVSHPELYGVDDRRAVDVSRRLALFEPAAMVVITDHAAGLIQQHSLALR